MQKRLWKMLSQGKNCTDLAKLAIFILMTTVYSCFLYLDPVAIGTDQEKLLARLEEELEQSRQLIRVQQELLQVTHILTHRSHRFMCNVHIAVSIFPQDSVTPPLPVALMDGYYLEEWERLQGRWEELKRQRRSFQRERQAFTDAAIRLGHEVGQSSWFYARDVL